MTTAFSETIMYVEAKDSYKLLVYIMWVKYFLWSEYSGVVIAWAAKSGHYTIYKCELDTV